MENKYKDLLVIDKARAMLEACAYQKKHEIDEICEAKPDDVPNLFRFVAALAVVYQSSQALQLVAETAARKMTPAQLQEFSASTLEGAIRENQPGHFAVMFDFMNERKLHVPALEGGLAECLGKKDRKKMAATLVAAGANVREAMSIHEEEVLLEIRRHHAEILQLRGCLRAERKAYGIAPATATVKLCMKARGS